VSGLRKTSGLLTGGAKGGTGRIDKDPKSMRPKERFAKSEKARHCGATHVTIGG